MMIHEAALPVNIRGDFVRTKGFCYLRTVEVLLHVLLIVFIHQFLGSVHEVIIDSMILQLA